MQIALIATFRESFRELSKSLTGDRIRSIRHRIMQFYGIGLIGTGCKILKAVIGGDYQIHLPRIKTTNLIACWRLAYLNPFCGDINYD